METTATADRIRVLRLLEYEGPRDWVEATLARSIQGTRTFTALDKKIPHHARRCIRAIVIPEALRGSLIDELLMPAGRRDDNHRDLTKGDIDK